MNNYQVSNVQFDLVHQFRARFVPDPDLIMGQWDAYSEHIGFFKGDVLFTTLRIVKAKSGRLPISDHVPNLPVGDQDIQVGRLVVNAAELTLSAVKFSYDYCCQHIFTLGNRVYIAGAVHGPISLRRYRDQLGFSHTGYEYYDCRYAQTLPILVRTNTGSPYNL